MNRRHFISRTGLAAGLTILPSGLLRGQSANDKLNIALIGVWGRGTAHHGWLAQENVVALCDVDGEHLGLALKKFPKAKTYTDWRKCLEQKDLDAVVIATPDHHHAFISNWALNRDLHVYCEKPLAITVEEARTVRANWLGKKGKLATQVGTQMHAQPNYARMKEMILDGAIGDLQGVIGWGNRKIPREGYYAAEGKPPPYLDWNLWLGPAEKHAYSPKYFAGGDRGSNCLEWNMFRDFGIGQMGDMGSHMMDLCWNGIDANFPTSIRASGGPFNPEVTPVKLEAHFEHPANDWRGPIRLSWYQGGALPRSPYRGIDLDAIGHGAMFKGDKGFIIADYYKRLLIPSGKEADLSYYTPRTIEDQLPEIGKFHQNWLDACKDPAKSTCCDFEYSSQYIEQMLLGLVAHQVGEPLDYDGRVGRITNHDGANSLLRKKYRPGWVLNG
ncbi:gfo/Idh/MocA family oxidoreductase [Coraliomargarita sinensis]|uniref:Gfo/Idh/MocA family oxidoreductase n=1 Tax=Coraliomargarita sinensis TaxID=2174842 RepID=A0A317ZKN4_9BACT|nr:Gfo/Idh/MocA family oxidoreductase [Coraliomargarita sinensis]PXA04379.1 gfo/Idh/MocA family oxidoreductase [Coraliomargarita sinensis]